MTYSPASPCGEAGGLGTFDQAVTRPADDPAFGWDERVDSHRAARPSPAPVAGGLRVAIACDSPAVVAPIVRALEDQGVECPSTQIVFLSDSHGPLFQLAAECDLTIVGVGENPLPYRVTIQRLATASKSVVVVGPPGTAFTLETMRAGAHDYLELGPHFEVELRTLLRRVVANVSLRCSQKRLYGVLGVSGGCGASILSVNLAAAIARRGRPCGLLDLHLDGGDLTSLLSAEPRHSISDLLNAHDDCDRAMFEHSLYQHPCGIRLLAGPDLFDSVRQTSPQAINGIVDIARDAFDYVVADLEDAIHPEQVRTVSGCDQVLLVMRLDFASLLRARKYIAFLQRVGIDDDRLLVVANRSSGAGEVPLQKASQALGVEIGQVIPEDAAHVLRSVNLGKPAVCEFPQAPFSRAVEQMAAKLLGDAVATPASQTQRLVNWLAGVWQAGRDS